MHASVFLSQKLTKPSFILLGFNEADKSSSILIYSISEKSIYTQSGWHEAILIKRINSKGGNICGKLMWHYQNDTENKKICYNFN